MKSLSSEKSDPWQNSRCRALGWLHDYRMVREYPLGVIEVCTKCRRSRFFHHRTPNHIYLSHHLRQALNFTHNRFKHEYYNPN